MSIWLGPPCMNSEITHFACGEKCGRLGASDVTPADGKLPEAVKQFQDVRNKFPGTPQAEQALSALQRLDPIRSTRSR